MLKKFPENLLTSMGMVLVAILAVGLWQLLSIWVFVIPPPYETLKALIEVWGQGDLAGAAAATAEDVAVGFALATLFGTLFGALLGRSDYGYRTFNPIIVVSAATPKIIVYPVLLLLLGIGSPSVIAMGFIGGIFPVLINVMVAVRDIKPVYVKVGRTLKISPWAALCRIYIPAVSLSLMAGIRLSFGLTLVNVVVAELFAAKAGMGKLIMNYYSMGKYPGMMALILLFFIVAMGGSIILWSLERRVQHARE